MRGLLSVESGRPVPGAATRDNGCGWFQFFHSPESTSVTQGARTHLLQQFDHLSPQLQTAARFVVDHPNDVLIRSMRQVAELAGVPPSTLVRLAQHLGYAGWPALKDDFAQSLGLEPSQGYADRAQRLAGQATAPLSD